MSLQNKFDTLAEKLAVRASEKDVPLEEATNALKAVTAYLAVLRKPDKGSQDEPEDDGSGFDFTRGIQPAEDRNGTGSRVPGRRRNG